eukprot:scaffold35973_cov60-Phaeocystis_antarctica.AAC.1
MAAGGVEGARFRREQEAALKAAEDAGRILHEAGKHGGPRALEPRHDGKERLPQGLAEVVLRVNRSLLVGRGRLRLEIQLLIDAHQRVRGGAAAVRIPVEHRTLAVPSGVRAATRHPPVGPLVHNPHIFDLQNMLRPDDLPQCVPHRGQALALIRIALAVGAAGELPGLLIDARVEAPADRNQGGLV